MKTLIMIYEMPDRIFDATSCGENCAESLLKIGKERDVTVNLRYLLPMKELEPFDIMILNTGAIVHTAKEYTLMGLDCLDAQGM